MLRQPETWVSHNNSELLNTHLNDSVIWFINRVAFHPNIFNNMHNMHGSTTVVVCGCFLFPILIHFLGVALERRLISSSVK